MRFILIADRKKCGVLDFVDNKFSAYLFPGFEDYFTGLFRDDIVCDDAEVRCRVDCERLLLEREILTSDGVIKEEKLCAMC